MKNHLKGVLSIFISPRYSDFHPAISFLVTRPGPAYQLFDNDGFDCAILH